jgi:hypothetical protein
MKNRCVSAHVMPALALGAALAASPVHAKTAVEQRVDTAPAPHLALRQGGKPGAVPIVIHYAHLKDEFRDSPMGKSHLADLKQKVAFCVATNPRIGRPVRAPAEFPDQFGRANQFDYFAPNRKITYAVTYSVRMAEDCSLIETEERNATLVSSKGQCKIDLVRKTAQGLCDGGAHADAVAYARPPGPGQQEKTRAALEADPRLAERMAVLRRLTAATASAPAGGARRTIAGLACQVQHGTAGIEGCASKDGSFVPFIDVEGVTLQYKFGAETMTAVEAKLDMQADAAIFAPYLTGGYTITAERK